MGSELSASNFDPQVYTGYFIREPNGHLVGSTDEIERLRPKSPPPSSHSQQSTGSSAAPQSSLRQGGGATPSLLGKPILGGGARMPSSHLQSRIDQRSLFNLLSIAAQNGIPTQYINPLLSSLGKYQS